MHEQDRIKLKMEEDMVIRDYTLEEAGMIKRWLKKCKIKKVKTPNKTPYITGQKVQIGF